MAGKMGLTDTHCHSLRSPDARDSVRAMCEAAGRLGLAAICMTDHYDIGITGDEKWQNITSVAASYDDVQVEIGRHGGLRVLAGVEVGQYVYDPQKGAAVIAVRDFDFVLGSLHGLSDQTDFYWVDYKKRDPQPIYEKYLEELIVTAREADFDSLAHLTYPLRYMIGRDGARVDQSGLRSRYDDIFRALISRGKALEINTSGFRMDGGFLLPDEHLLRRFRELGGEYVTLGSDAHNTDQLGADLTQGLEAALRAGFSELSLYVKRKREGLPVSSL